MPSFAEVKVLQQQNMLNVHHMHTWVCTVFKWNYEQHLYTNTLIPIINRFASTNEPLRLWNWWKVWSVGKSLKGAKEKYRGVFEIQRSGDKTNSGEIGLDIRTHASPKVGQDQVSGGVSVLCLTAQGSECHFAFVRGRSAQICILLREHHIHLL